MTSAPQRTAKVTDFEQSIRVSAPVDDVFAYLSDVRNAPEYLPTVKHAEPQQGDRIRTQGQAGEHSYDSDGHFHIDHQRHRLEWGSDGENDYRGWLEVQGDGDSECTVRVGIHYAPPQEMVERMSQQAAGHSFESAMNEGIQKTLESIRRICEGEGGKVEISPNQ